MDTYLYGAHGRICLFLADLNAVLGGLPAPMPYGPAPTFTQVGFPRNVHGGLHQQSLWKRPTRRSQSWRNSHSQSRNSRESSQKAAHPPPSVPPAHLFKLNSPPAAYTFQSFPKHQSDRIQSRRRPPKRKVVTRDHDQTESKCRHQVIKDSRKQDHRSPEQSLDEDSGAGCNEILVANDDCHFLDNFLSPELDDPEELDDQSVLDIDLGPECCHPILAPAAPMETELHPSDLDGDVDVDNIQSDFVMDTCSNAEDLSASYASRRVNGNNDESALVIDPGPTAQDIARFQPNLTPTALSDPGITSLDHTRDDRNNNDQSNLIEVPLTAPRRPLLPTLRTVSQWRRPAERYPDHKTEDLQLTSTRRLPPLRTPSFLRRPPERFTREDDSASEDKAPRPMSRYQRLQLDDRYQHSQLNDVRPNNHRLNNFPPSHLNHFPEHPSPHQHSPSPLPEDRYPYYSEQPNYESNNDENIDPHHNSYSNYDSDLNNFANYDHKNYTNDHVDTFEDQQLDYEAGCDVHNVGGDLEFYDDF